MSHNHTRIIKLPLVPLLILLGLLLVAMFGMPTRASAGLLAPQEIFFRTPAQVGVFTNRVHVRCNPAAPNNISYFAFCSTGGNSMTANRVLSIFYHG